MDGSKGMLAQSLWSAGIKDNETVSDFKAFQDLMMKSASLSSVQQKEGWGAPKLSLTKSALLRWGVVPWQGEWREQPPPSRHHRSRSVQPHAWCWACCVPSLHALGGLLWTHFCLMLWLKWSLAGRGMCRMCLLCEFLPEGTRFARTQTGWQHEPEQSKWRWLRDSPENGEHFRQSLAHAIYPGFDWNRESVFFL